MTTKMAVAGLPQPSPDFSRKAGAHSFERLAFEKTLRRSLHYPETPGAEQVNNLARNAFPQMIMWAFLNNGWKAGRPDPPSSGCSIARPPRTHTSRGTLANEIKARNTRRARGNRWTDLTGAFPLRRLSVMHSLRHRRLLDAVQAPALQSLEFVLPDPP